MVETYEEIREDLISNLFELVGAVEGYLKSTQMEDSPMGKYLKSIIKRHDTLREQMRIVGK